MNTTTTDITAIPFPASARAVLQALEANGFEAWVVGGYVRDAILKRSVHDVDIATNAHWQQVRAVCEAAGMRSFETGIAHGTLTVQVQTGEIVEVTTYRTEGSYSDARHPDSVRFVQTIEEDLARRDFTMNALAWHPQRGLFDPFDGIHDLNKQCIRCVGNAHTRFSEDALRIVRAARFAAELGFSIEEATLAGAHANISALKHIAIERVYAELSRLLCGSHAHNVLLNYPTLIDAALPELKPLRGFDQKSPYHIYDIMEHAAYVVKASPQEPLLRWAALLHDIGKPASFTIDPHGQGHFFGHATRGAEMVGDITRRFKMPKRFATDLETLVRFHDTHIEATPKAVKGLLHTLDGRPELLRQLCTLQVADATAHAPQYQQRGELACRVAACLEDILANNDVFSLRQLAISGKDICALGVTPGPRVGEFLNSALSAVINEEIANEHDALQEYIKKLL